MSDIDTAAVDSLKVLDPKRPIREADMRSHLIHRPARDTIPRSVELEFPPIGIIASRLSCGCGFPGPSEFSAIRPYAVHDHGQPTRQGHNRLLQSAAPGDLHRPGLEP